MKYHFCIFCQNFFDLILNYGEILTKSMPIIFKTFADIYVNNRNSKSRRISTRRNGAKENRISAINLFSQRL